MCRTLSKWQLEIGANLSDEEVTFRVWAPFRKSVAVALQEKKSSRKIDLYTEDNGFFSTTCNARAGVDYFFILDKTKKRPDPASRFQAGGVHGPSRIVNSEDFEWSDQNWRGVRKKDLIIYEVHVGTFTKEGNFRSVIAKLKHLKRLGVAAVELMPVGQFPGRRNWGYDGAYMYAPQNSYGGPTELKRLIDSCHAEGLAVILDVVYNHVGPEGNYLGDFGPYFSDKYHTPWGRALNYDSENCDEVRRYVVSNALYWISEFHVDGLRLDAVHGIFDSSAKHILLEISQQTHLLAKSLQREFHLIAESDLNDPKILKPAELVGYEMDAQWSDDFHHSVHAFLTGERKGYYLDFGTLGEVAKSIGEGFVIDGKYSNYRKRSHGFSSKGLPGDLFVIYTQNHDQVGNRLGGERLSLLVSKEKLKLAVGLCLLSQSIPMLFMGEEYAESSPFYYFVEHSVKSLIKAVRKGRMREFMSKGEKGKFIDPQSISAFRNSKLDWVLLKQKRHKEMLEYYKELIELRRSHSAFEEFDRKNLRMITDESAECLYQFRKSSAEELLLIFSFGKWDRKIPNPVKGGTWEKVYDSSQKAGQKMLRHDDTTMIVPPESLLVYSREG